MGQNSWTQPHKADSASRYVRVCRCMILEYNLTRPNPARRGRRWPLVLLGVAKDSGKAPPRAPGGSQAATHRTRSIASVGPYHNGP
jgi:hypothetical protein